MKIRNGRQVVTCQYKERKFVFNLDKKDLFWEVSERLCESYFKFK